MATTPRAPVSTLLAVVVSLALAVLILQGVRDDREERLSSEVGAPAPECAADDCVPEEGRGASAALRPTHPVLSASTACRDAGYLCAALESRDSLRIYRWAETTRTIRVRVPLPEHELPGRARELQRAAVRGILAWQDHPFRLALDDHSVARESDFEVRWAPQLPGATLGATRTRWSSERGLEVLDLQLATRSPHDPGYELPARQVELTAAHEMGHALGLPHSDQTRDVMYAKNTALSLTARDYLTLQSLYALPNGAEIRR